jgi:hypothetical protein
MAAYAGVWLVLVSAVAALLVSRRDLDVQILRQPGTLYATLATGEVANFYDVQAFNRTARPASFTIEVTEPRGAALTPLGALDRVDAYGQVDGRLVLRLPTAALTGPSTPVRFAVRSGDGAVQMIESAFLGPPGAR